MITLHMMRQQGWRGSGFEWYDCAIIGLFVVIIGVKLFMEWRAEKKRRSDEKV